MKKTVDKIPFYRLGWNKIKYSGVKTCKSDLVLTYNYNFLVRNRKQLTDILKKMIWHDCNMIYHFISID
jgi:hypothetical protein